MYHPEEHRTIGQKKNILIIEDEEFLCKLLTIKLEQSGFEVKTSFDGESGLKAIETNKPDVILLDLLLPGMDGFEVAKQLKNDPKTSDIPIIVVSNLGEPSDIAKAEKLGVVEYLVKADYTPDQIVKRVLQHIEYQKEASPK